MNAWSPGGPLPGIDGAKHRCENRAERKYVIKEVTSLQSMRERKLKRYIEGGGGSTRTRRFLPKLDTSLAYPSGNVETSLSYDESVKRRKGGENR